MTIRQRSLLIRNFIIDNVGRYPDSIARVTADQFDISKQAARNHLKALEKEGVLYPSGKTRGRKYHLLDIAQLEKTYKIGGLQEDVPWSNDFAPLLDGVNDNVLSIAGIAFTEMLNNAIDHSASNKVSVTLRYTAATIRVQIRDEGVGIFRKIKNAFDLKDEREAILELEKGRLTTSPEGHTGYGIFFTSRMVDIFTMWSWRLLFTHVQPHSDWLIEVDTDSYPGTCVDFTVSTSTTRTAKEVYDEYCTEGVDGGFNKTHVPISLAQLGNEQLVSRSQAKRVLSRFDKFQEVLLDFAGVDFIGQAFADEIFRVFAQHHPEITLGSINTNPQVSSMIRLAIDQRRQQLKLF